MPAPVRTPLTVVAMLLGLVVAAAAPAGAAPVPSPTPTVVATPVLPGAPTITAVGGGTARGQLAITYTVPAFDGGSPITGYQVSADNGVNWWPCAPTPGTCTLTNLTYGRSYSVIVRALNAVGAGPASAPRSGVSTLAPGSDPDKPARLPSPRVVVGARFTAASNDLGVDGSRVKVGVGALPEITFTRDIPDKAAVERHLFVTAKLTSGGPRTVPGAWGWTSNRSAVFRPVDYWPGHALIQITSTLDRAVLGRTGKTYVVGGTSLKTVWSFRTARSLIIEVDGAATRMKVYVDGKETKDFPVSLGKSGWNTRSGVKVISTRKERYHTYTSAGLGLDPETEYYVLANIPWNTRLTPTGEFIHAAPWAYGRIGRYNGSHGCTNMFATDAQWIYEHTIPGDVVVYSRTGGSTVPSWNGPGGLWNVPWKQWERKSALESRHPDTSDPARPGWSAPQEASA